MDIKEFRDYLTKFNYPNINELSDEEIGKIFSSSDRIFLLSWLANLIEPLLCLDANSKETPALLSNFIYECGFCTKCQKDPFVNGNLPLLDQLIIMKKMFIALKSDDKNDGNEQNMSISEIETHFESINLNLFPELGPIKTKPMHERQKIIDQLKKSYEETQQQLLNLEESVDKEFVTDGADFCDATEKFQLSAIQFEMVASVLLQRKRNFRKSDLRLNCDKNVLKTADKNLDSALRMIRDTKAVIEFPEINKSLVLEQESENFDGVVEVVTDSASLFNEVRRVNSYCS